MGEKYIINSYKRVMYKLNFFILKYMGWFFYPTTKLGKEQRNTKLIDQIVLEEKERREQEST